MTAISGGKPWDRYVQNGLAFQLDAETQCSPEQWVDIKNGVVFTPHINHQAPFNYDSGHPYFNANNVYMNQQEIMNTFPVGECTIEVCVKRESGSTIINGWTNTIGAVLTASKITFNQNNATSNNSFLVSYEEIANKVLSISMQNTFCVFNGEKYIDSTGNDWQPNSTGRYTIGGRWPRTTYWWKGYIYCIRIYNRKLTDAEIRINQAIDLERFGDS